MISSDNLRTERDVGDVEGVIVFVGVCEGVINGVGVIDGVIVPVGVEPKLGDDVDVPV